MTIFKKYQEGIRRVIKNVKSGKYTFHYYAYKDGEFFDFRNLKVVPEEEVKNCINDYIIATNKYQEAEPCEICGADVPYGFSLCDQCTEQLLGFDEVTGNYIMKNGVVIDTLKHQY